MMLRLGHSIRLNKGTSGHDGSNDILEQSSFYLFNISLALSIVYLF